MFYCYCTKIYNYRAESHKRKDFTHANLLRVFCNFFDSKNINKSSYLVLNLFKSFKCINNINSDSF